jgi:hypothetical protein
MLARLCEACLDVYYTRLKKLVGDKHSSLVMKSGEESYLYIALDGSMYSC